MPRYNIGEIPPQNVWFGAETGWPTLSFDIDVTPGAQLSFDVVPNPAGHMVLEDGRFNYTPAATDTFDFILGFTETRAGEPDVRQEVVFMPHPTLEMPETELVAQRGALPPDDGAEYIVISDLVGESKRLFNSTEQATRRVHVSGKRLVLDGSVDANGLYTRLHGTGNRNSDIEELFLYADVVEVTTPIHLPQTNVTIIARQLAFTGASSISTTPAVPSSVPPAPVAAQGHQGGSITLRVARLDMGDATTVRFITSGGAGQDAQPGKPGSPGTSISRIPKGEKKPDPIAQDDWDNMTYWEDLDVDADSGQAAPFGKGSHQVGSPSARPGNGTGATPAGMPGAGGRGGDVRSSVFISLAQMKLSGGESGAIGSLVPGGDPGDPNPATHIRRTRKYRYSEFKDKEVKTGVGTSYEVFARFYPSRGEDGPPPGPADQGDAGSFSMLTGDAAIWVHPYIARAVLAYAKDLYLNGHMATARDVLASWHEHLGELGISAELQPLVLQLRAEMQTLIHRIDSNRDYFGNPAGWVPMLSLEGNFRNYDRAVADAMTTLYLAHWIQARAQRKEQAVRSLRQAIEQADAEIAKAAAEYTELRQAIPQLQLQAGRIQQQLEITQNALALKEQEFLARAQADENARNKLPFWKQATRTLGAICKFVPVYQPVLGSIGTGLDLLSNIDTNAPLETVNQIGDLAEQFTKAKFDESRKDLDELVKQLNRRNSTNNIEYVKGLVGIAKQFDEAIKQIENAARATQVPKGEIDAELRRIKEADPEFTQLAAQVAALTERRKEFGDKLKEAVNTVASFANRLAAGVVAVNELNASLLDAAAGLDQRALTQVRDMERRARETLIEFQYYLAKSYEYRMLKPFPIDYQVNHTVAELRELVSPEGKPEILSQPDFQRLQQIYLDPSRNAVVEGVKELQKRPPDRSKVYSFGLSTSELEILNREGEVVVDLRRKIRPLAEEENRRIAQLSFEKIEGEASDTDGDTANVTITVEHRGESVIRSGSRFHYFNHRSSGAYPPFTWAASFDAISKERTEDTISDAWLSLTSTLLGVPPAEKDAVVTFTRPGADAELKIRREITTPDVDIQLTTVRLSMRVDFFRAAVGSVLLGVEAVREDRDPPNVSSVTPYITCSPPDLGGHKNGRGTFTRVYNDGDQVMLQAPLTFGSLVFRRWMSDGGVQVSDQPRLEIELGTSKTVRAVYEAEPALGHEPLLALPGQTLWAFM